MESSVLLHVGMCVADLGRSLRFYCSGLGFERERPRTYGRELGTLLELDNKAVSVDTAFIHRDGVRIELLHFMEPRNTVACTRKALHGEAGLTHLTLLTRNIDAAVESVRTHGGQVLEHTRAQLHLGPDTDFDAVFCCDPDGIRIELLCRR